MHFNLANHSSPIAHVHSASMPGVQVYVTADRVLWMGITGPR